MMLPALLSLFLLVLACLLPPAEVAAVAIEARGGAAAAAALGKAKVQTKVADRRRRRGMSMLPRMEKGSRSNINLLSEGSSSTVARHHRHQVVMGGAMGAPESEGFLDGDFPRDSSNPLDAFLDSHPESGKDAAGTPAAAAGNATAAGNASALQVSLLQFLPNPVAKRLVDFKAERLDTAGMTQGFLLFPSITKSQVPIFTFDPSKDSTISAAILRSHEWEADGVTRICSKWGGDVTGNFLDVGANIGTFTLPMAYCLQGKGSIIAVEGMPTTASHLKASIIANNLSNVALYNYAVGNAGPQNDIKMKLNIANPGGSSVLNGDGDGGSANYGADTAGIYSLGGQVESIGLTTLDAMFETNPDFRKVLVMKMDIEGNEGRAFAGATKFLGTSPPCFLMVELSTSWLANAGTPLADVRSSLEKFGYEVGPDVGSKPVDTYFLQQKDVEGCIQRVSRR